MADKTPPVVDGITAPSPGGENKTPKTDSKKSKAAPNEKQQVVSRMKFALITFIVLPYLLYIIWCLFLLSVLPDATGKWEFIVP